MTEQWLKALAPITRSCTMGGVGKTIRFVFRRRSSSGRRSAVLAMPMCPGLRARTSLDATVAVMVGAGHEDETYELAGDNAYTLTDLATEAARQIGKPVAYTNLSEATSPPLERAGLPRPMALVVAETEARAFPREC